MSWSTALSDLRTLLNDNTNNRYCYRKKIFGVIDGTNVNFKTFEFRRITDFTTSDSPLGVYLDGVLLTNAQVDLDDVVTGEFTLKTAPEDGSVLTATYYYHWFLDSELGQFLTQASNWLQAGSDYTQIPGTLQAAALDYACNSALKMISMRWAERASAAFLLEDAPKKEALGLADTYLKQADIYYKSAIQKRNDNYTRAGQTLAPNFVNSWGRVSAVTPRR